jgi:hypothetical protein
MGQVFLPSSYSLQTGPSEMDLNTMLSKMYPVPRRAPLYPGGLNGLGDVASDFAAAEAADVAKYGSGAGDIYQYICALTAAGYFPTGPDLYHSQWVNADGDVTDVGNSFLASYPQFANLIGTSCALPTIPGSASTSTPPQPCPAGWTGIFPDCTPTAAAIATAVPAGAPPVTFNSAATPPTTPIIPASSGISNTATALASSFGASTQPANSTSQTQGTTATTTASWFTDPTQEIISGVPNWGLVVGGAGVVLLLVMGGKR